MTETHLASHPGISRMTNLLKNLYYWEGMCKDVENFVRRCESCQRNKISRTTRTPMRITTTAMKPFEKVFIDIVGPLPPTNRYNKYILTIQDDLTKFCDGIAIPNQETETVARAFVENFVCKHGIPETILSDQGSNFTSQLFKAVSNLLKVKRLLTTAYHPQTNGALERSHRTLAITMLSIYLS